MNKKLNSIDTRFEDIRKYSKNWMELFRVYRRKVKRLNSSYEIQNHPAILVENFSFYTLSFFICCMATYKERSLANDVEIIILVIALALLFVMNFFLCWCEGSFLCFICCKRRSIPKPIQLLYVFLNNFVRLIPIFLVGTIATNLIWRVSTGLTCALVLMYSLYLTQTFVSVVFIVIPTAVILLSGTETIRIIFSSDKNTEIFLFLFQSCSVLVAGLISSITVYYREKTRRKTHMISFFLNRLECQTKKRNEITRKLIKRILPKRYTRILTSHLLGGGDEYLYSTLLHREYHSKRVYCQIDLVRFCETSKNFEPRTLIKILDFLYLCFDKCCKNYGFQKLKTEGDAYISVSMKDVDKKECQDADLSQVLLSSCLFCFDLLNSLKRIENVKGLGRSSSVVIRGRVGCYLDSGTIVLFSDNNLVRFDIYGRGIKGVALFEQKASAGGVCVDTNIYEELQSSGLHSKLCKNDEGKASSLCPSQFPTSVLPGVLAPSQEITRSGQEVGDEEEEDDDMVLEDYVEEVFTESQNSSICSGDISSVVNANKTEEEVVIIGEEEGEDLGIISIDDSEINIVSKELGNLKYYHVMNTPRNFSLISKELMRVCEEEGDGISNNDSLINFTHIANSLKYHEQSNNNNGEQQHQEQNSDENILRSPSKKNNFLRSPSRKGLDHNYEYFKERRNNNKKVDRIPSSINLATTSGRKKKKKRESIRCCACFVCIFLKKILSFLWSFLIFQFPSSSSSACCCKKSSSTTKNTCKYQIVHLEHLSHKTLILSWIIFVSMTYRLISIKVHLYVFHKVHEVHDTGIIDFVLTQTSYLMYSIVLLVFTVQHTVSLKPNIISIIRDCVSKSRKKRRKRRSTSTSDHQNFFIKLMSPIRRTLLRIYSSIYNIGKLIHCISCCCCCCSKILKKRRRSRRTLLCVLFLMIVTYISLVFWYLLFEFCLISFDEDSRMMNMWFSMFILVIYLRETYLGVTGIATVLAFFTYSYVYYYADGTGDFYGLFCVPVILGSYYMVVSWRAKKLLMDGYCERGRYEVQILEYFREEDKNRLVVGSVLPKVIIDDFVRQFKNKSFLIYKASGCVCFIEIDLLMRNKNNINVDREIINNNNEEEEENSDKSSSSDRKSDNDLMIIEILNRIFHEIDCCCSHTGCQKIRTSSNKYIAISADLIREKKNYIHHKDESFGCDEDDSFWDKQQQQNSIGHALEYNNNHRMNETESGSDVSTIVSMLSTDDSDGSSGEDRFLFFENDEDEDSSSSSRGSSESSLSSSSMRCSDFSILNELEDDHNNRNINLSISPPLNSPQSFSRRNSLSHQRRKLSSRGKKKLKKRRNSVMSNNVPLQSRKLRHVRNMSYFALSTKQMMIRKFCRYNYNDNTGTASMENDNNTKEANRDINAIKLFCNDYEIKFKIGFCYGDDFTAGIIGTTGFNFDVLGSTVNLASRCMTTIDEMNQVQFHVGSECNDFLQTSDFLNDVQEDERANEYEKIMGPFRVKSRGDVFVKGFGEIPLFLLFGNEEKRDSFFL